MEHITIRKGVKEDYAQIARLISESIYNSGMPNGTAITVKELEVDGSSDNFMSLVAENDTSAGKKIIGYVLYCFIYSTFLGRSSYIVDIYITDAFRHCGAGINLLKQLVKDVLEVGCTRVEYAMSKYNLSSTEFCKRYDAVNLTKAENWNFFLLEKEKMIKLAENSKIKSIQSVRCKNETNEVTDVIIRKGEKNDCSAILKNIIEMAHYARDPNGVKINVEDLEKDGFGNKEFYKCFVAEADGRNGKQIVGYALYFFGYATNTGRISYMEDLFVTENFRHLGLGAALWKAVVRDGLKNGCTKLFFSVLSWNTASIKFYEKYEAYNFTEQEEWELYRFGLDVMKKINNFV